jgi:hypothetical protein
MHDDRRHRRQMARSMIEMVGAEGAMALAREYAWAGVLGEVRRLVGNHDAPAPDQAAPAVRPKARRLTKAKPLVPRVADGRHGRKDRPMEADTPYSVQPDIDFHIDRYGNLWISRSDGGRRLATSRERLIILQETPEMALSAVS